MSTPSKRSAAFKPAEVKTATRPWILFGLFWIISIFAGFGGWAATAQLASAVIAMGTMTVDSKHKLVQHLEGGIVEELMVRDGDVVQAGDGLVKLDPTRAQSMLAIVLSALQKEQASEARLLAESTGADKVKYPETILAAAGKPEVKALIDSQTAIFEARRNSLHSEVAILEQRIAQLADENKGLVAQREAKQSQMGFIQEELDGLKYLLEQGHAKKPAILALERQAAALKGEEGELLSSIAKTSKTVGETKLQIIQRQQDYQKTVTEELEAVQGRMRDLEERVVAARDVLNRINITAPVGGTVVNMTAHTVGAVIKPGETVLEIVPGKDELVAEVIIRPQDIDIVTMDEPAVVRLLAFKQRTTPLLHGKVVYVSADSLENQATRQPYYLARIEVPEEEIAKLGKLRIQPGMQVEVMIRTGERTAFRYLIQPMLDSLNKAWREE